MIDPTAITNFNLSKPQLEEHILFWVLSAGKNGRVAARCLDRFLSKIKHCGTTPFEALRNRTVSDNMPKEIMNKLGNKYSTVQELMKDSGIGCSTSKSRSFTELAWSNIDLSTCEPEALEGIYGIGMKTSRCFIMHSRKNSKYAGLDTHMLKHLREEGVDKVPKSTPNSKKEYCRLEKEVLNLAAKENMSPAEFDLMIWNKYSVKK